MTITRVAQCGFEIGGLGDELPIYDGNVAYQLVSSPVKTGNFCLQNGPTGPGWGFVFPALTNQARISFHLRHDALNTTNVELFWFRASTTEIIRVRWDGVNFVLLQASSTTIGTYAYAPFASNDTWFHISFDVKIDGAAGWARMYVDGVQVFDFSGDNNNGGAQFDRVLFGDSWGSGRYVYYDDIYIEDTAGEATPSFAPDYRYQIAVVNDDGAENDWVGSDGNQVDNFLLVDDLPPDDDTTYLTSSTVTDRSQFLVDSISVPSGWSVESVIPLSFAKKDSAGDSTALKLSTKVGANEQQSASKSLGTDYTYVWDRQLLNPAGGAWSQSDLDGLSVIIEHA